jgi:hypothetical protein
VRPRREESAILPALARMAASKPSRDEVDHPVRDPEIDRDLGMSVAERGQRRRHEHRRRCRPGAVRRKPS